MIFRGHTPSLRIAVEENGEGMAAGFLKAADAAARWHVHNHRKEPAEEPYLNHLLEVAMLVAEAKGEHRGVMSTISRTDAMSEYQRDQAIAKFVDRDRSRRILRLVDAKLRELAEEVADLLREENNEAQDFESLWEAICYYVAKGKQDDLNKYEEPIHAMCRQALQECYGDRFTAQVLAAITTQCDEFYQKAGRRDEPSPSPWTSGQPKRFMPVS